LLSHIHMGSRRSIHPIRRFAPHAVLLQIQ
jgi:hypothetical protein